MFTKLIPSWILIAVFAALAFIIVGQHAVNSNQRARTARAEASLADTRMQYAQAAAKKEAEYRQTEQSWRDHATRIEATKNDQITTLNTRVSALSGELRKRPSRPASGDVPTAPASCPSGTGAGLYREDGVFLAGEAAAATRIAIERDACRAQYNQLLQPAQ